MSVDLSTTYLGLKLRNPAVIAASPLSAQISVLQRLEEAGAAAAVLPSLFEEQIEAEGMTPHTPAPPGSCSATEFFPYRDMLDYNAGPDAYLRHVEGVKKALSIPVIGSLNGTTPGGWVRFARLIQEAGADALELNVYYMPTRPEQTGRLVDDHYVELVAAVRAKVSIPLAVKIGPFFSSLPEMASRLVEAGANGLTFFNRFLQPDIDLDTLEVSPTLVLSSRDELRLPLRWIAILREQTKASLAATSGIHFAEDLLKLILAGADVGMIASALIRNGPEHLRILLTEVEYWLERRHFASVEQIKGSLSQRCIANPGAFERVNYMRAISSLTSESP
ncbi:MAG TPA: dihydroorotate dehydrogenase-like protein [Pirellulales bacterium]|nr:dihydroorotate dehydrogenase-like protein [Pirellulales bacterium]